MIAHCLPVKRNGLRSCKIEPGSGSGWEAAAPMEGWFAEFVLEQSREICFVVTPMLIRLNHDVTRAAMSDPRAVAAQAGRTSWAIHHLPEPKVPRCTEERCMASGFAKHRSESAQEADACHIAGFGRRSAA